MFLPSQVYVWNERKAIFRQREEHGCEYWCWRGNGGVRKYIPWVTLIKQSRNQLWFQSLTEISLIGQRVRGKQIESAVSQYQANLPVAQQAIKLLFYFLYSRRRESIFKNIISRLYFCSFLVSSMQLNLSTEQLFRTIVALDEKPKLPITRDQLYSIAIQQLKFISRMNANRIRMSSQSYLSD